MTDREFKRPPLRHRGRHLFRQLFSGWPWIIWLGAAVAVLLLLPGGLNRVRFHGVAERTYEYVAPIEDGRLKTLLVGMGDTVHAGQLIGEIDNASLAAEMLMDQASLMKTRDKVYAIECDVQALKLEEAKTAAELQALESRWKRQQELKKKNLLLEQDMEDLEPQIEAARKVLAQYPGLLARLEARLAAAQEEVELFGSKELRQLQEEQRRLTATTAGVVAEVLHLPGDVVETGDPVLRISNVTTSRIIAFIPEESRSEIAEGETCRIITATTRTTYTGTVKTVTADIRKLPVFTGFGDQILRGRRIVIDLDHGAELVPGERVVVVPDVSLFEQWFGRK
ncbi:HlyD family secretion protein [Pontiella sp.]|uniref:HlyD family secretion protein n=1 Tax=Pontiella sp. TaxID=2837462 RepID=UPI003561E6D1